MTERGRVLCQRVARRIGEVAPVGIGKWAPAWSMVSHASDDFLDRLWEWEGGDTPGSRAALTAAAASLVRGWRRAGVAWEDAGRPLLSLAGEDPQACGSAVVGGRTAPEKAHA